MFDKDQIFRTGSSQQPRKLLKDPLQERLAQRYVDGVSGINRVPIVASEVGNPLKARQIEELRSTETRDSQLIGPA